MAIGRPTKYRPEFAEQARKLCLLGATDKELADFFENDYDEDAWIVFCFRLIRDDRTGKSRAFRDRRAARRKVMQDSDASYRVRNAFSARMWEALKGKKDFSLFTKLGYTLEQLMDHLESKFIDGMSWNNYGKTWHVDHKKPCSAFDLTDQDQFNECWSLNNLQPLFASENISKGAKYACP